MTDDAHDSPTSSEPQPDGPAEVEASRRRATDLEQHTTQAGETSGTTRVGDESALDDSDGGGAADPDRARDHDRSP